MTGFRRPSAPGALALAGGVLVAAAVLATGACGPAQGPEPAPAAQTALASGARPVMLPGPPGGGPARALALAALESHVEALAAETGGVVGFAALHLETGERSAVRGGRPFPMLSVFKLPVAVEVLARIERGEIGLGDTLRVGPEDMRLGRNLLAARLEPGGIALTVRELLELMLVESDNPSADVLLERAGGPATVTARMRALGIGGIRVDRSEGDLILDYFGVYDRPPADRQTLAGLQGLVAAVPRAARSAAAARFAADPRDTTTPEAAIELLASIRQGLALGPEVTAILLDLLGRTAVGEKRIPGLLPPGTKVAHRTGTGGSTDGVLSAVNDVGLIELPGGAGTLAVAIFVQDAVRPVEAVEPVIARLARAAYDFWSNP